MSGGALVDDETIEAYRRDGAACLRQVFDPQEVALAATAIDQVLAHPGPLAIRASAPDDGAFVEDFRRWADVPVLAELATTGPGGALTAALTGSQQVRLHHDHVLVKEPATRQETPWHQDQPYYDVDGTQTASFWIPVDPVPEVSSLRIVAGSHRGPWYLPRTFLDGDARWFPEGSLADLPDVDADPDRYPVLSWELEPGDVVVFHFLALHAAGGVPGPGRRRVLSLRYVGDDVQYAPRPWRTSPPFDDVQLEAGAPLEAPQFPVVWPVTPPR